MKRKQWMKFVGFWMMVCGMVAASVLKADEIRLPERGLCAHRGENGRFPENTVRGFREAVRLGAAQVEFDVRKTKDGRMIILHDATVDRTTDGKGSAGNLTFDEIRALDAGVGKDVKFSGTKIPTLEEALDGLPRNIWINVHVGNADPVEVGRVLVAGNREHQAFMACNRKQMLAVKDVYPQIMICNMQRQSGDNSRYIRETIEWSCEFIQLRELGTSEEMIFKKDNNPSRKQKGLS